MKGKVLPLLKARLGISTTARDLVLEAIIGGIVAECKNIHGLVLDENKEDDMLFTLDWATWKYTHPEDGATPRSIDFRLKNMIIKKAGTADEQ